jgi:prepilin-type processing-associated H-X9-DG protein
VIARVINALTFDGHVRDAAFALAAAVVILLDLWALIIIAGRGQ